MDEFDTKTVGRRSVQGIIALISRTFFLNIVSYGTSLVIFTVLAPSDFGIYTAAIAGQRVVSFFTDFGFGAALIQKREALNQANLKTAFTIQALVTLLIFIALFFLQERIASFFHLGMQALNLFLVLVFSIFLSSFKIVPSILLERKIHFQKLIIPQIAESLIFNILLVILVLQGFGIESYTWSFLVSGIIGIPFYYIVSPWKIAFGIDRSSLRHLYYGVQFQGKNVLATIKDDVLTVFLAKVLTFSELGYIGFGQRNAFFAYRFIVDNVTKVTFSTYARMQDEAQLLRKTLEKSLFLVSATVFPLLFGIVIVSPYIISYFPRWQQKWEPAILSLTFFSLNAIVSSMSGILVTVLDATGRIRQTLLLMVLWTVLTWVLTLFGIYFFGYNGVAIASFIVTLTIGIPIYLVKRIVPFHFLRSIYKPLFCSGVMAIFVYLFAKMFVSDLLILGIIIVLGGLVYIACLLLVSQEIKEDIKILFRKP